MQGMVECLPELVRAAEGSSSGSGQASAAAGGAAAQEPQPPQAALPHRAQELRGFAVALLATAVHIASDGKRRQIRRDPFIPRVLQYAGLPRACAAALQQLGGRRPPS
jgi:hypothetical protein